MTSVQSSKAAGIKRASFVSNSLTPFPSLCWESSRKLRQVTLRVEELPQGTVPRGIVLREADVAECWAGGLQPDEAVAQSIALSEQSFGVWVDDVLLGVWGYAPLSVLGSSCRAWCLTTPLVEWYKPLFTRLSITMVRGLLDRYNAVYCEVDTAHGRAIRWLGVLGFKLLRDQGRFALMCARRVD